VITELDLTPDPAAGTFRVDVRLDKPVDPETYLFVYVHDHVKGANRRGNRWGQFYSAVLPTEPAIDILTIEADVETGVLRLSGGGRSIPMPDQRPAKRHRQVISRAKHLRVEVVLRNFQPTAMSYRRSVIVVNPWHGGALLGAGGPP